MAGSCRRWAMPGSFSLDRLPPAAPPISARTAAWRSGEAAAGFAAKAKVAEEEDEEDEEVLEVPAVREVIVFIRWWEGER